MSDGGEAGSVENALIDQSDAPIGACNEDRPDVVASPRFSQPRSLRPGLPEGYDMGLNGQWGSGKTNVFNMSIEALRSQAIVVQFNPRMFSGIVVLVRMSGRVGVVPTHRGVI